MSYHLDDGQVLLPPQVLLDLGSTGGQAIIQVHQDVDCCVHVRTEERCKEKTNPTVTLVLLHTFGFYKSLNPQIVNT